MACSITSSFSEINVTFSPTSGTKYIYNEKGDHIEDSIKIDIDDCQATVQNEHYIMIALGVENNIFTDKVNAYSINDYNTISNESNKHCRIEGKYINKSNVDIAYLNQRLLDRRKLLNKCSVLKVTDESEEGLEIPEKQNGCIVKKIDKNTAIFEGFFCFIKPHSKSKLSLEYKIKNECLQKGYMEKNKIIPQDLFALLDFYAAGDASGQSPQLNFLKDFKLRMSASADGIIKTEKTVLEEDPKYPVQWKVNDIDLGKLSIEKVGSDLVKVKSQIYAKNICEKQCAGKLCSSACNYTQPLAGEYTLSKINKKGKKEFISLWYDGGVIPSNWAGIINGLGNKLKSNLLEVGSTYEIEVKLEDQDYYYTMFKNRIGSRLKLMHKTIPEIKRDTGVIQKLQQFNKIIDLDNLPSYPVYDYVKFKGNNHIGVMNTVNSINRTFKDFLWPPYLESYCIGETCAQNQKHELTLRLKFKITKEAFNYEIEYLDYNKITNFNNNKKIKKYEPPFVSCSKPGTDPTDNDDNGDWDDDDLGDIDF